jgi:hypothetical protein
MRWLAAMFMVLVLVGVSFGQDVGCGDGCNEPCVQDVRLLSWGEATCIVIYVHTPFEEAMYDIRWSVFNKYGKKVRHGGSMGWFFLPPGVPFVFEESMKKLNNSDYYVRAWIEKYAYLINNER